MGTMKYQEIFKTMARKKIFVKCTLNSFNDKRSARVLEVRWLFFTE
jgi:hypothetical protein